MKKIFLNILLFSLLFIIVFLSSFGFAFLKNLDSKDFAKDDISLGIQNNDIDDSVINIALFGLDNRDSQKNGRSDSIMVASFDRKHNKLKLISLMRDSYVEIDNHGSDKLNHAYALGGPSLAIKTINQNFGLNIRDYVSVNFTDLAYIINNLGGIEINIKDYEVTEFNKYIDDVQAVTGLKSNHIEAAGVQTLDGVQAVAYARIRYVGNGDYERTERQRNVLSAIFNKAKSLSIPKFTSLASDSLNYIETSLSATDTISLGTKILTSGINTVEQERFPTNQNSKGEMIDNIWYLTFDKDKTKEQILNYLNEDIKPVQ